MKSKCLTLTEVLSAPNGQQFLGVRLEGSQPDHEAQSPKQMTAGSHGFSDFIDFGDSLDSFDQLDSSLARLDTSQTKVNTNTASLSGSSSGVPSVLSHNNSSSWCASQNNPIDDHNGPDIVLAREGCDTRLQVGVPADEAGILHNRLLSGGWPDEKSKQVAEMDRQLLTAGSIGTGLGISWDLFDEL